MAVLRVKAEYIVLGVALLGVFLLRSFQDKLIAKLAEFIPSVEGFQATPYWDVNRYSWGYGTAAPGPSGTITRAQAFTDMVSYLLRDYVDLSGKITRKLTVNQWAALLSFSYNLGVGNAYNLVPVINSGDDNALGIKWNKYVYAGGVINDELVSRRAKEFSLWQS